MRDNTAALWAPLASLAKLSPRPASAIPSQFGASPIGDDTNCTEPVVAGGGTNYLTVWEHDRPGTSFQDIHGRLSVTHPVFLPGLER